jgi:hypothetical protein
VITEHDDYLTHQTFETHDRVFMGDPRWTERFIFDVHDPAGEVLLWCGLGIYPNTRYMDGFAICWHEGVQRNVRCGREREEDLWRLHAGPMRFDVVEPLKVWRLALEDAGHGLAYDIHFSRITQPFQMPTQIIERDGAIFVGYSHFVQAGRYEGWIEVGGTRHDVGGWTGERDRSWGVRPASARVRRGFHTWLPIQFDDLSIWVYAHEDRHGVQDYLSGCLRPVAAGLGEEPGPPVPVTAFRHELDFDLVGPHRVLAGGTIWIEGADGRSLEIAVDPLGPLLAIYGGGYGGAHAQGTPKGPLYVDGELWDLRPKGALGRLVPHSILERSCSFRAEGRSGHGNYEHCLGEYEPKGFPPVD